MKLKIGFMGAIHPNMPGDDTGVLNKIMGDMEKMQNLYDYELVCIKEPLRSEEDAAKAVDFMNKEAVDFLMLITTSLGNGRVMIPVAKSNAPLGLWAIPEPVTCGVLQLNSFCGLNMFSAIIDKYWAHKDIRFKWFYGYPDSEMFKERFGITVKALKGVKAVKEARIGVIGDVANGFENFIFDERELNAKLGSYVYTRHGVPDIVKIAEGYSENEVSAYTAELLKVGKKSDRLKDEHMAKFARTAMAFEQFAKENNYNALAINCWPTFQQYYNIAICSVMSHLNNIGIAASCEADVPGVLNMLMLNAISNDKAALMDLVSIDDKDNSVNLWHCGPAPACFANEKGVKWDNHFNIGKYCDGKWVGDGVVADLTFKPGKLTIARMSCTFDDMFVMTGDILNKEGFEGSTGWMGNLTMQGTKLDAKMFIETLIDNRIDHHFPVVYGDISNELYELSAWLKLKTAQPVEYVPYMKNKVNKVLI